VVRELPRSAQERGLRPELWVASAGYGLVHADSPLHAYSATFAPRQPDSVVPSLSGQQARDAQTAWWDDLSTRQLTGSQRPRSVCALASNDPKSILLVVGSPRYVSAMRGDLLAARNELRDGGQLLIVSSEDPAFVRGLEDNLVPTDARLLRRLGSGSRVSLHAQTARMLLTESRYELNAAVQRPRLQKLLKRLPAYEQPSGRAAQSDAQVKTFIRRALTAGPTSRTGLLREFRKSGRQCEQKRFKRLFDEVAVACG